MFNFLLNTINETCYRIITSKYEYKIKYPVNSVQVPFFSTKGPFRSFLFLFFDFFFLVKSHRFLTFNSSPFVYVLKRKSFFLLISWYFFEGVLVLLNYFWIINIFLNISSKLFKNINVNCLIFREQTKNEIPC